MHIGICAILSDFRGRVLLQQADPTTLRPPHSALEPGSLPADALAQLMREQTGLIVWPVRLTGVYYRDDSLTFSWRCTMRGGDLPAPAGQPTAGFFDSAPLPAGLSSPWRQRVDEAVHHAGGPPVLRAEADGAAWLRRLLGRAPTAPANSWEVEVVVWAEVEPGRGVWRRGAAGEGLGLPRATTVGEAPWTTAARLLRTVVPGAQWVLPRLILAQSAGDRPALTLLFAATMTGGEFRPAGPLVVAAANDSSALLDSEDREMAADLDLTAESPLFRLAAGPGASGHG